MAWRKHSAAPNFQESIGSSKKKKRPYVKFHISLTFYSFQNFKHFNSKEILKDHHTRSASMIKKGYMFTTFMTIF